MPIPQDPVAKILSDTDEFQSEVPPASTAPANTRPNSIAQIDATSENGGSPDAALESNGATAQAQATPGEIQSDGPSPHRQKN